MPICMACTFPKARPWHDRCPGWVDPRNLTNVLKVPCGCTDPAHRDGSTTDASKPLTGRSTVRQ